MYLLVNQNIHKDITDIYAALKDKALEGDSNAIKNLIMLQKEIKHNIKEIEKKSEAEDDGLKL